MASTRLRLLVSTQLVVNAQYNGKLATAFNAAHWQSLLLHQNILIKGRRADSLRADEKHRANYSLC